eukprot:scaffold18301_cov66-Phaeocystis_antarctica.AAC.1
MQHYKLRYEPTQICTSLRTCKFSSSLASADERGATAERGEHMHVGCRLRPVDAVDSNGHTDGAAGGAAVCGPELQRGRVAVDAHHGRAARGDRTGAHKARGRARPAHDAGVHLRPRLGPANRYSAARATRGRRAMAEDRAVLLPEGGQAAVDDARPRPPHHAAPAATHAVHEDPQRLVLAPRPLLLPTAARHTMGRTLVSADVRWFASPRPIHVDSRARARAGAAALGSRGQLGRPAVLPPRTAPTDLAPCARAAQGGGQRRARGGARQEACGLARLQHDGEWSHRRSRLVRMLLPPSAFRLPPSAFRLPPSTCDFPGAAAPRAALTAARRRAAHAGHRPGF